MFQFMFGKFFQGFSIDGFSLFENKSIKDILYFSMSTRIDIDIWPFEFLRREFITGSCIVKASIILTYFINLLWFTAGMHETL